MTSSSVKVRDARTAGPFRVRAIDYAPGLRQAVHAHETGSVTLLLAGRIRETTRSGEERGSALSVVVKPPGVRHADEVGARGARTLQVAFDPATAGEAGAAARDLDRWTWLHGGSGVRPLLTLARALRDRSAGEGELEDRVLEALAGLGAPDVGGVPEGGAPGPRWVRRVREALDDDPFGDRSVRDLARLVGVHPVSLSRAFRRAFGVTITEYRQRLRLRRAARRITAGEASLSRAAHAAGYSDHPHMCRDLRRRTGLTPSELRLLAGGG